MNASLTSSSEEVVVAEYTGEQLEALMPHPRKNANKYSRGKLCVIGGSAAYPGAACLAAFAAQRAGAGYVEVWCEKPSVSVVQAFRPSLVARSWDGLRVSCLPAFREEKPCACVVGPGFEASDADQARLALRVVREARMPVLVDGGAISALASAEGLAAARGRANAESAGRKRANAEGVGGECVAANAEGVGGECVAANAEGVGGECVAANACLSSGQGDGNCEEVPDRREGALGVCAGENATPAARHAACSLVVTPHAGEAARLCRAARLDGVCKSEGWASERLALELARAYACVMVLKGPDTFVSDGYEVVAVRQGTPALAKAGTGDVLAGVIGALLAQGLSALDAAVLGATLHAEAGCAAAAELTEIAVVPEDVTAYLPAAIKAIG